MKSTTENEYKGESKMNTNRKSAVMVGLLYNLATAAGMVGIEIFTGPALSAPDYLVNLWQAHLPKQKLKAFD